MPRERQDPQSDSELRAVQDTVTNATLLLSRRLVITGVTALSNAVAARLLGVSNFGDLSAALAVFYLLLSLSDFGFSLVTSRVLAREKILNRVAMTRGAVVVQTTLAAILAAGGVVYASSLWGPTFKTFVLLSLLPALIFAGTSSARPIFLVKNRVRLIASIDIVTNMGQAIAVTLIAIVTKNPVAVAICISAGSIVNSLLAYCTAHRLLGATRFDWQSTKEMFREAIPLGLASVTASAYATIDMVILGWYVTSFDVGIYAAAVKVLSIVASLPVLIASAALPTFSHAAGSDRGGSYAYATLWKLLNTTVSPICITIALFAPAVVLLLYGPDYSSAGTVVQVLMAAGLLTSLSNLLGTLIVAQRQGHRMLLQNLLALFLNVGANVTLVPVFGILASAIITVATEAFVIAMSARLLTKRCNIGLSFLRSDALRVVLAWSAIGAVAAFAGPSSLVGFCTAPIVYVLVASALRLWPTELLRMVKVRRTTL